MKKDVKTKKSTKKVSPKKDVKVVKEKSIKAAKNEISELRKLAYIFCVVIGLFLIFYGLAYLKVKNKNTDEPINSVIQYKEILASNITKQNESEYYVMVYNDDELYERYYQSYITVYETKDKSLSFYSMALSNEFNKDYTGDTDNLKDINNLKFKSDVLVRVKDGKLASTYVGEEAITKQLKTLCGVK